MQTTFPTATATPSPSEIVKQIEQVTQVIDVFKSLGPVMGLLFIVGLVLFAMLIVMWFSRNNLNTVTNILANNNAQKDKEINDLKAQREQAQKQHVESLSAIHKQMQRGNDLSENSNRILEAVNTRGGQRDLDQQKMAADLHEMVSSGSKPVQEILQRVREIAEGINRLDMRTADWPETVKAVTSLMQELGGLRAEAKKHSTQPIPVIDISITPESGAK
jgi:DNA anti-recombination protein RmuC